MSKQMTFIGPCAADDCIAMGFAEYGGFCCHHWLRLSPTDRASLWPHYEVPRTIEVSRHEHTHHNPPYRPGLVALIGMAAGLAGAALPWALWWFLRR